MNESLDFQDGTPREGLNKKQVFKNQIKDLKPHEKREAKYVFELQNAIEAQQKIKAEHKVAYTSIKERLAQPVIFTPEDIKAAKPPRQAALFKLIEDNASHWDFMNSAGDRYILVNTIEHDMLPKDEIARRDVNIATAILRQAIIDLKDPLQREHTLQWIHGEYDSLVSFEDAVNGAFPLIDEITPSSIRNRIIDDEEAVHEAMLKYKLFESNIDIEESDLSEETDKPKGKWYENKDTFNATAVTLDHLIETGFRDPLMVVKAPGEREFTALLEAFGYNVGYFTREKKDKSAMLQTQFHLVELAPTSEVLKKSVAEIQEKRSAAKEVEAERRAKESNWLKTLGPESAQTSLAIDDFSNVSGELERVQQSPPI